MTQAGKDKHKSNTLAGSRQSRYKQGTVTIFLGLRVTTIKNTVFNKPPRAEIQNAMLKSLMAFFDAGSCTDKGRHWSGDI